MTINGYPRLCGGTFFTLLLQARKQRSKPREHRRGERDGLSDTDTLIGLIKIVSPDYCEPTATTIKTFKGNTFDFKSCKISGNTYLPFSDTQEVGAFDNRVQTEYGSVLNDMREFVVNFIDVGTRSHKDIRLSKALLELIDVDESILERQEFYIFESGQTATKSDLREMTDVCLPAFLLGVWHFVLTERKDNTIGKETYDTWCPPSGGGERKYVGYMGDGIGREISVFVPDDRGLEDIAASDYIEDESNVDYDTPHREDETDTNSANTVNQTANNPVIFNQYGNNNTQIGSVDTLTISNGWRKEVE